MIVVYHIPKTAGTSLRVLMWKHVPPERRFTVADDIEADIIRFKREGRDFDAFFGHVCVGSVYLKGLQVDAITVLRDPLQRVRSLYDYIRRGRNHYLHMRIQKMSLQRFMESGVTCTVDNAMVRQLCGVDAFTKKSARDMRIPFGKVTREHLEMAKQNLKGFALVGLQERYGAFQNAVCDRYGWKREPVLRENVLPKKFHTKTPPELRYNHTLALDYELFEFAEGIAV